MTAQTSVVATEERWTYAGRVLDAKNKVRYAWLDADGNELIYDRIKGASPGAVYTVRVERRPEGVSAYDDIQYEGLCEDEELRLKFQARDKATGTQAELRRAEKSEAYADLEEHLTALADCYRRQVGGRRTGFLAYCIQRITGGSR